jgi:hypothetical protein
MVIFHVSRPLPVKYQDSFGVHAYFPHALLASQQPENPAIFQLALLPPRDVVRVQDGFVVVNALNTEVQPLLRGLIF